MVSQTTVSFHHAFFFLENETSPSLVIDSLYSDINLHTLIGTQEEQRRVVKANLRALQAIKKNGAVIVEDPQPDIICEPCLSATCLQSGWMRAVGDKTDFARFFARREIEGDPRYLEALKLHGRKKQEAMAPIIEEIYLRHREVEEDFFRRFR